MQSGFFRIGAEHFALCHLPARLILTVPLILSACNHVNDLTLATQGAIDNQAPVQSTTQIVIAAAPEKIWRILTAIHQWPQWQHDIKAATTAGPPATGANFQWTIGVGTIRARIAFADPPQRLAWTGNFLIFHAIHIWMLKPLPNGKTEVTTRESMAGWPIAWLFSSSDLTQSNAQWLAYLKREAERS